MGRLHPPNWFGSANLRHSAFEDIKVVLAALHDFGGVRITVYLPGDIDRMSAIINERFNVIQRGEKHNDSQHNIDAVEERIGLLQEPKTATVVAGKNRRYKRDFSGYKATKFTVKLRGGGISEEKRVAWKDLVIEIEVVTIIMHMWSQIVNDLINEPLDVEDTEVSGDEGSLPDLINGLALVGEVPLKQLEASTALRNSQHAAEDV